MHHNRVQLLKQAIASLESQTYTNFEVILVDDGSTDPEAIDFLNDIAWKWWEQRGWKVLKERNNYLGAARNAGGMFYYYSFYLFIYFDVAERASGKYILFMDDDDIAKPHQLETYARVALATNAELLTTGHDLFPGTNTVKRRKPNVFFYFFFTRNRSRCPHGRVVDRTIHPARRGSTCRPV